MIKENITIDEYINKWYETGLGNYNASEFVGKACANENSFIKKHNAEVEALYNLHLSVFNTIIDSLDLILSSNDSSCLKLKNYLRELQSLSKHKYKVVHIISTTTTSLYNIIDSTQLELIINLNKTIAKKQIILINELQNDGYLKNFDSATTSILFRSVILNGSGNNLSGLKGDFTFEALEDFILSTLN